MNFSFINIYRKSKVVLETDKYLIHRRLKSKLSYADNYLQIKEMPKTVEDLDYYIDSCRNFFRDKGVAFINIALPENSDLDSKLIKYLTTNHFKPINFDLYVLETDKFLVKNEAQLEISKLERNDYSQYFNYAYDIDLKYAGKEFADYNKESIYEDIRSDDIDKIIIKDKGKIVASVNVIINSDYLELDNIYVNEKYRRQGLATSIIAYAVKKYEKKYIILLADADDTPKYMYEKMGFEQRSKKIYFLKNEL